MKTGFKTNIVSSLRSEVIGIKFDIASSFEIIGFEDMNFLFNYIVEI